MHDECRMREKTHQSKAQDASNIKHIASILKRCSGCFMSIMCHLCINRGSLKFVYSQSRHLRLVLRVLESRYIRVQERYEFLSVFATAHLNQSNATFLIY